MTDLEAKKMLIICPGDTIQETLEEMNISPQILAEKLGYSLKQLNQLIKGEIAISHSVANKLEKALNIPANTWLELERMYQKELQEITPSPIGFKK